MNPKKLITCENNNIIIMFPVYGFIKINVTKYYLYFCACRNCKLSLPKYNEILKQEMKNHSIRDIK